MSLCLLYTISIIIFKEVTSRARGPFFQPLVAVVTVECHFRKHFPSALLFGIQETPRAFEQRPYELSKVSSVINTQTCWNHLASSLTWQRHSYCLGPEASQKLTAALNRCLLTISQSKSWYSSPGCFNSSVLQTLVPIPI